MKRFSRSATIMFLAAITVASGAITFAARIGQEAQRHSEILSALDRLKALDAGLDRDLLEIVSGRLNHYDSLLDLSQIEDQTFTVIADDSEDFPTELRDRYRDQMATRRAMTEKIKGLSAFVINEETYLQFEIPLYSQTAPAEKARLLQSLLITQLGNRAREWRQSRPDEALAKLERPPQSATLANLLLHFHELRDQRSRLEEAVDGYFSIANQPALDQLRDHYMRAYQGRQARMLAITQIATVSTIFLFLGLGWTLRRLGQSHDETERSRGRLLDAVACLKDAFVLFDASGHAVVTNPPYREWLGGVDEGGYSALIAALRERDPSAGLAPNRLDQEQVLYDAMSERWILFRSRATGEGGAVCLVMDITKLKHMEDELRKLTAVVEQSPLSIVITDSDGRIEYVNDSFTALTGYPSAEVVGRNPRLLNSGLTPQGTFDDLWATISAGLTWRGDVINRTKSGEIFIEHSIVFPILGIDGVTRRYIALKENVTLLRRNAEMVVDAKSDMERLLFAASHDIQEPIRDLLLHIQLLERHLGEALSPESRDDTALISRSGHQLSLLIKGLLDYNRSVRPVSVIGSVNSQAIVERVVAEFTADVPDARVIVGDLPTIEGDPALLSILLENLISNAVKFGTPGRRLEVSVSAYPEKEGWRIEIADNGIGIEEDYLRTIIRPFSRLHPRSQYPGVNRRRKLTHILHRIGAQ